MNIRIPPPDRDGYTAVVLQPLYSGTMHYGYDIRIGDQKAGFITANAVETFTAAPNAYPHQLLTMAVSNILYNLGINVSPRIIVEH